MAANVRSEVRVAKLDGSTVILKAPVVEGDSIVGYESPAWDQAGNPTRRAIAVTDVRSVSVWERDKTLNTILWVAGATFGALLLLNIIAAPYGGIGGT